MLIVVDRSFLRVCHLRRRLLVVWIHHRGGIESTVGLSEIKFTEQLAPIHRCSVVVDSRYRVMAIQERLIQVSLVHSDADRTIILGDSDSR